jgi:hypothetical protein
VEGPCNVIADTFSRLLRSNVSSPLVGKEAANVASGSESNDRNESSYPEWYSRETINSVEDILCYTKPGDNPANRKVALPEDLIKPTVSGIIRLLDIQEARGSMDNYDNTIIEIYVTWLTMSPVTFARETN